MQYSSAADLDKFGEEFIDYQLMELKEVPESVLKPALVVDDEKTQHYRMDNNMDISEHIERCGWHAAIS